MKDYLRQVSIIALGVFIGGIIPLWLLATLVVAAGGD